MEVPRHWRLKRQRYCLVGEICPHCDEKIFPPRDICPRCGGETSGGGSRIKVRGTTPQGQPIECEAKQAIVI